MYHVIFDGNIILTVTLRSSPGIFLNKIIIIKVFVRHKILYIETNYSECIHTHACMHTRTHACTHARTHTHTHTRTHTHTHTPTRMDTHTHEHSDYRKSKFLNVFVFVQIGNMNVLWLIPSLNVTVENLRCQNNQICEKVSWRHGSVKKTASVM